MTLDTCEKLYLQYEAIASGAVPKPKGHAHWDIVVKNARVNALLMKKRIESRKPKDAGNTQRKGSKNPLASR